MKIPHSYPSLPPSLPPSLLQALFSPSTGILDMLALQDKPFLTLPPSLLPTPPSLPPSLPPSPKALFSPSTGILDSHQYMRALLGDAEVRREGGREGRE